MKTEISEAAGHSKELCKKIYRASKHLLPTDISEAILHVLRQPNYIDITEITIKPTGELF